MEWIFHLAVVIWLCWVSPTTCTTKAKFEHHEEWKAWKVTHSKNYVSEEQEIERHIVWLSNKEYIDQHNANAHLFGFTLALNHFGDMVNY